MNQTNEVTKNDGNIKSKVATRLLAHSPPMMLEQGLTNSVLQFFSTASSQVILGIALAFAALVYALLGRVGLLLIGVGVGILLHTYWESQNQENRIIGTKDKPLDIIKKLLELRNENSQCGTNPIHVSRTFNNFDDFQPETAAALRELVEAIIRDYVKYWYHPILPNDSSFIVASQQALTRFISSISLHISKKRPADVFLDFLTNSSSITIVFLGELSAALSLSPGPPAEAVSSYLSTNPDSSLANALDEEHQKKKLKLSAMDLLQTFLEKTIYDCDPARIFLTELMSSLVLETTLQTCSKPECINGWIVSLLEKGEPDISQMIDAGMNTARSEGTHHETNDDSVSPGPSDIPMPIEESRHGRLNKYDSSNNSGIPCLDADEEVIRLSNLIAAEEAKRSSNLLTSMDDKAKVNMASEEHTNKYMDFKEMKTNGNKLPFENNTVHKANTGSLNNSEYKESTSKKPHNSKFVSASPESTTTPPSMARESFKSFDQLNLDSPSEKMKSTPPPARQVRSLTLHNAIITINDDNMNTERGKLRNKPNTDYLIQIEPPCFNYSGWMIVRRYSDFESLHEVLRRIAQVSGVIGFTEQHHNLPSWKDHTKASLRGELERYLRDACWFQQLAESEGMKRFLKKDEEQHICSPNSKNGFSAISWTTPAALEMVSKGVLDVITSAPKGVAGGGKAITGVLNNIGNLGHKKSSGGQIESLSRTESVGSISSFQPIRLSEEGLRYSFLGQTPRNKIPFIERDSNRNSGEDNQKDSRSSGSTRSSMSAHQSVNSSTNDLDASPPHKLMVNSDVQFSMEPLVLPPTPSEISDHFTYNNIHGSKVNHSHPNGNFSPLQTNTRSSPTLPTQEIPLPSNKKNHMLEFGVGHQGQKMTASLTESETKVAVELMFAVISEMYTISSAWNIRRTLLAAAKTYFLRPGNPSLSKIQSLIQESVILANTSDTGVACHLRRLRENCLSREEESKPHRTEKSAEEMERLRIKARNLLINRGVPIALTGLMGQAATSEAMGRIFDCLQVEKVARGLIFGLLLQVVRAVIY